MIETTRQAPEAEGSSSRGCGAVRDALLEVKVWRYETAVLLAPQDLVRVCRYLRDHPDLTFDFLSSVTGVDRLKLPENSRVLKSSITSTPSSTSGVSG